MKLPIPYSITHITHSIVIPMVILALLTLTGCTAPTPISESRLKLGTNITITAHDTPPRGTFTAVWDRIDEIEKLMSINSSRYTSTEIMEVNQAAGDHAVELSADSMHVLQTGIDIGRLSDGAFDITIAPLVLLWQVTTDDPSLPPEDAIEEARRLVDYTEVQIDGNAVFLPEPGMGIDLGGIAKGYAANEAA
ncbi:MAG: FAD:protein FMN transferase, partial [Spirochaeta sp.]